MPAGQKKKKVVKHSGKKNKIIRSKSIKRTEECDEKEEGKEILPSSEDSEKTEEDVQATTSEESVMEETRMQTILLESHEDEPILKTPPSPKVDHNAERVKDLNMQVEQLTMKVEKLTTKFEQDTKQAEQLVTELGKYKARCSELENELRSLSTTKQQGQEDVQNQLKLLNQKLAISNTKLCESHNQCQQLKQELKLVHKALANEVGDNACIQEILSGTSNWRGRAQQILMLQKKVSDLQTQLQEINGKEPPSPLALENAAAKSKSAQALKQLEKERRANQEIVAKQLQEKTAELEEVQKRVEGIRARNRTLEGDVANLKATIGTLMEKGRHDDQLISALTVEIKRLEAKLKEYQESEKVTASQWDDDRQRHKKEIAQEKAKSNQMQAIIKEKDEELKKLTQKLAHLKDQEIFSSGCLQQEAESHPLNDFTDDNDCAESKDVEYYQKSYHAAEGECTRLLELIAVYNKRLDEQRRKADETEEKLQCERQKSTRLEAKVAQLELEKSAAFKSTYSFRTTKQPAKKPTAIPQEVQEKLELLQEQNLTLQTRLKRLKQEKCEDLKMFTKILSNKKQHPSVKTEKMLK